MAESISEEKRNQCLVEQQGVKRGTFSTGGICFNPAGTSGDACRSRSLAVYRMFLVFISFDA
jgi:hypothetical protein